MNLQNISKGATATAAQFLNLPFVKEGVKNIAGSVTFVLGFVEIYDIYQILNGREISTEIYPDAPKWIQVANKIVVICAKISLIFSAIVSRPGVFIFSTLIGCVFTTVQLEWVFGPNTIFAVNPWHPRHILSFVAVALALPAVVQATYRGVVWTHRKICNYSDTVPKETCKTWLTDAKLRLMVLFNTITSRPILHTGNQLCRLIRSSP